MRPFRLRGEAPWLRRWVSVAQQASAQEPRDNNLPVLASPVESLGPPARLHHEEAEGKRLRDYQVHGVGMLEEMCSFGKSPLYALPTGGGKTVAMAELTVRWCEAGMRTLILVHRREIFDQYLRHLRLAGLEPSLIDARLSEEKRKKNSKVVLAMVQTLTRRLKSRLGDDLDFDRIVVDEAHHATATSWKNIFERWPHSLRVGATATPFRSDGSPLGEVFDEIVKGPSISELIDAGNLVKPLYRLKNIWKVENVPTTRAKGAGGTVFYDYDQHILSKQGRTMTSQIVDNVALHLGNRRALVFAVDVDHSKSLMEGFKKKGFSVAHVDALTPHDLRDHIFRSFRDTDKIQIVCNCGIATEGFDAPACQAVVLARPTKSRGLFLQMTGRGLRPAPNKTDCLFFDYASQLEAHGFVTDPQSFELLHKKKQQPETEIAEDVAPDEEQPKGGTREGPLILDLGGDTTELVGVNLKVSPPGENVPKHEIRLSWRHKGRTIRKWATFDTTRNVPPTTATLYATGFDAPDLPPGTFGTAHFNKRVVHVEDSTLKGWFHQILRYFLPKTSPCPMHNHFTHLLKQQHVRGRKSMTSSDIYKNLRDKFGATALRNANYDYLRWKHLPADYAANDISLQDVFHEEDQTQPTTPLS